ncbi:hypothetical protein GCM10027055_29170 [Janibacter alkaliphilus]
MPPTVSATVSGESTPTSTKVSEKVTETQKTAPSRGRAADGSGGALVMLRQPSQHLIGSRRTHSLPVRD